MLIYSGVYTSKAILYCKMSWKSLNIVKVGWLRHRELCFSCILELGFSVWLVGLAFLPKYIHLKYSVNSENLKRKEVLVEFVLGNNTYKITKFPQPSVWSRVRRTGFLFSPVFLLNVLFCPVPHLLVIFLTNDEMSNFNMFVIFFQLHS